MPNRNVWLVCCVSILLHLPLAASADDKGLSQEEKDAGFVSLFNGTDLAGWESLWQWSLMALAGALATPVCFKIFDSCHRLFNYQPLAESSFRPDREIKRSRY